MKTLKLAILALALLAAPALGTTVAVTGTGQGTAVAVTGTGQNWSLNYNGIVDVNGTPTVVQGLSAQVDFTVTGLAYDSAANVTLLTMDMVIANTSDSSIWQFAQVGGIAFDTDPNAMKMGSGASGAFGYIALNQLLPGSTGFGVEICASGYRNRCDGNYLYGVKIGATGTATVQLSFAGDVTGRAINLSAFAVRWSDLVSGQYGFMLPTTGDGYGVPVIPEPASAAVFGVGALLVAAAIRRKRAK